MSENNYNTDEEYPEPSENKSTFREILDMVLYVVVLIVIFTLIRQFLFVPVSVDGPSMLPTLEHGDRLILTKVGDVTRFDVVVFPAPDEEENQYIKRVIGVPGDSIEYIDDNLYINDQLIEEPYVDEMANSMEGYENYAMDFTLESLTDGETATVPEGQYFVMGDNRPNSKDSRIFGFIDADNVIGVTDFRFWPLEDFGTFNKMDNLYGK